MSTNPNIDKLTAERDAAKLRLETARFKRGVKVMQKWDAVEPNRLRRQASVERKDESGIYDLHRRMRGCNLGRDLERNYSPASGMLHQMRVNVVGAQGKIRINLDGEKGKEGTEWFNEVWAKDCDFRDDVDWSTQVQNILISAIREGDLLSIIDDGAVEDSGKMLTWESDQIAPVSDDVLNAKGYAGHTQDNGIIRDKWGRIVAYCASGERGMKVIDDPAKVTIWKREDARLIKNPWRVNQGRGTPQLLTAATNFIDLYEILSAELMTTKRAARQYAYAKRSDAVTDWDDPAGSPEYLPENDGRTADDVAGDGANESTKTGARNYENLEMFTGGLTDYLQPGDDIVFPDANNPNGRLAEFIEAVHGYSGAALGLARAYAILRADSSYTSFRGDMILTWVTFRWLQKWLERTVCDWTAIKVLAWAQKKNHISKMPAGWERAISWDWPTMPSVDEARESIATTNKLKNGTIDYAKLLGPNWKAILTGYAEQLQFAREANLPLAQFETKSGGTAPSSKKEQS